MPSQDKDKLFHYTSPQGLIGIITSNELWASDIFSLNDAEEMTRGMDIARKIINNLYETTEDTNKKERIDRFKKDLANIGPSQNISTLVCSLTGAGDQLSQWRAYCAGGGYAIGFPLEGLKKAIDNQDFLLAQCIYDQAEQEKQIEDLINDIAMPWIENPEQYRKKNPWGRDSDIGCGISSQLIWDLHGLCATLKNSSFIEEKEWRLVSKTKSNWFTLQEFRDKKGLVVPYVKINLPNPDDREFWHKVEVVIGPTAYPEESKTYVHSLLRKKHSHNIPIKHTTSSFREL